MTKLLKIGTRQLLRVQILKKSNNMFFPILLVALIDLEKSTRMTFLKISTKIKPKQKFQHIWSKPTYPTNYNSDLLMKFGCKFDKGKCIQHCC